MIMIMHIYIYISIHVYTPIYSPCLGPSLRLPEPGLHLRGGLPSGHVPAREEHGGPDVLAVRGELHALRERHHLLSGSKEGEASACQGPWAH